MSYCEGCATREEMLEGECDARIAAEAKLAASEKRMREVAAEMENVRIDDEGYVSVTGGKLEEWRAKLLEGLDAE